MIIGGIVILWALLNFWWLISDRRKGPDGDTTGTIAMVFFLFFALNLFCVILGVLCFFASTRNGVIGPGVPGLIISAFCSFMIFLGTRKSRGDKEDYIK